MIDNGLVRFVQDTAGTYTGLISGAGSVEKTLGGTLTLTGTNTYSGGTTVNAGELSISTDANLGAVSGGLILDSGTLGTTANMSTSRVTAIDADGGTVGTDAGTTLSYLSNITGDGTLAKTGDGTLVLSGTNVQAGGTAINGGVVQVTSDANLGAVGATLSFDSGTLLAANGISIDRPAVLNAGGGTIEIGGDQFDPSQNVNLTGSITGSGNLTKTGTGTLILAGTGSYTGKTDVAAGSLYVNGDFSAAAGAMTVESGSRLGGGGTYGGSVIVANGARLTAGAISGEPGTFNVGNLTLNSGSLTFLNIVNTSVGGALNDLINVNGNLVLDGTIDILEQGQDIGPGVYRVFNYSGSLTDNGLDIGSIATIDGTPSRPLTGFTVQTAIPGQVNLVNANGLSLNYWDGTAGPKNNNAIDGGNGVWRSAGASATANWTDPLGAVNAPWSDGQFAIFIAAPGTVDVVLDNGPVATSGMQFGVDGYLVQGAALTLVDSVADPGEATIRVGDGTSAGAGMTATISAPLTGAVLLRKTDIGTLVLSGINSYTGGTVIDGGTVRITSDANLGDAAGQLTFNGGTLQAAANMVETRATVLGVSGGTIQTETAAGTATTLEYASAIGGTGALTKTGSGTLLLTANNPYRGGTTISEGILQLGNGGTAGGVLGFITDNAALVVNRSDTITLGPISGTGSLEQAGTGTTILGDDTTYTGGTTISAGTLQLGNGRPNPVVSTTGADTDIDRWQAQMGVDLILASRSDGSSLVAGITGQYGKATTDVRSMFGGGRIKTQGYGIGATLTWYGPRGFYVDGQAKFTWYDSDLKSTVLGQLVSGNKGTGKAFSVEMGKRSPLGGHLSVTPQMQMVYSTVDFDRFADPADAVTSSGLGDSLKSRWGISLDYQKTGNSGNRTHLYGLVNISYEWLEGTRVDVSGTPLAHRNDRLWGELGLGGSYSWGHDRFTLYTEISANTAMHDFGDSYGLKGEVGLRVGF